MFVNKTKYGCSSRKKTHYRKRLHRDSFECFQFSQIVSNASFQKYWKLCRRE